MTNKKSKVSNVPNLRFPGFDGEWEIKKLGEVMDFKITNSFSRENLNYELGTVKNIHYGDIHTKFKTLFNIKKEIVPFINEEMNLRRISDENYCREGDIIFADASEDLNDVGKSIEIINVNGEKLLSGLHTLLARPKANIFHLGFNGYLFKSNQVRTQIQKESQGSKVLSINVGRISKIDLSFPAVVEQEKISTLFSLFDKRIHTQNKIIKQLETLIKGLYQKIFEAGRFQFSVLPLKLLCIIKKGEQINASELSETGLYYVMNGGISPSGYYSEYNSEAKTISISEGGNSCGYVQFNNSKFWYGGHCYTLNNIHNSIKNKYLYYYLKANENKIMALRVGSGLPNIQKSALEKFEVKIPNIYVQEKVILALDSLSNKVAIESKLLKKYQQQKKHLLQNLFI
ncbi:restriction endonuclease subunit S [uncultured Chryseobacterium sp.]|uniref:restriction endonuclease subunit S n=1 Tax=uncultured Chryseobacterium sp. TaxID=259322 RepID=UPI0025D7C17D|nr:restriction endonuclease subunit S [uncultured Chryseobacterium sp.]